jgi:hypothetical protein
MRNFLRKIRARLSGLFFAGSGKRARLAEKLAEGLVSRDGDEAGKSFMRRLEESAAKIFPAAEAALRDGKYESLAGAFNALCIQTLDDDIVDEDFPIVRTAGYFRNSYAPVRMLLSLTSFFAGGENAEAFLCGLVKADQRNHHMHAAFSHILSQNGKFREAADEALAAQRLMPYDNCVSRRVNDTQRDLLSHDMPTDFALPNADKSQLFCSLPFLSHQFVRGSGKYSLVAAGLCYCSEWTSIAFERDASWNSKDMQLFRASILDGSFKYCDEIRCLLLNKGHLASRSQITDVFLRSIIDNNTVLLEKGPESLTLGYDLVCNLRCPSCRREWSAPGRGETEALNDFADTVLTPLLADAERLQLSTSGEALASPHSRRLLQSLRPVKYPNLKVTLLSNLSLISPRTWEQLGDAASCIKKLTLSIDGSTPETLEKLRVGLKWERMLDALGFVRTLRQSGALDCINISFVLQKDNYKELPGILDMACEYLADGLNVLSLVGHGVYSYEEFLEINISDKGNPLYAECKEIIEEMKENHTRMLQEKDAITASGRSVPQIFWRQA